jgi:hypothetical protein
MYLKSLLKTVVILNFNLNSCSDNGIGRREVLLFSAGDVGNGDVIFDRPARFVVPRRLTGLDVESVIPAVERRICRVDIKKVASLIRHVENHCLVLFSHSRKK